MRLVALLLVAIAACHGSKECICPACGVCVQPCNPSMTAPVMSDITGTVLGPDDAPVAGAKVTLTTATQRSTAVTDHEGVFVAQLVTAHHSRCPRSDTPLDDTPVRFELVVEQQELANGTVTAEVRPSQGTLQLAPVRLAPSL